MKIKLIAFDVNGTLFDDILQGFNAVNSIFPHYGKPMLSFDEIRRRFGQPWTSVYREEGITEEIASDSQLYEIYNQTYSTQEPAKPHSGVKQVLENLMSRRIILGIVSAQQNIITIPMLEKHDLLQFFPFIKGRIDDKAEAIKQICLQTATKQEETAYVGDQVGDILHARNAGCIPIAFTSGLHTKERLLQAQPDFAIDSFPELLQLPIF